MKKICVGMSDRDRKKILNKKKLNLSQVKENIKIRNVDEKSLDFAKEIIFSNVDKKKIARRIYQEFLQGESAEKLPVFKNEDIKLEFEYSKLGISESLQHQGTLNYDDFAKMLTCFNEVVKNGIGLEVHENRYDFDRLTEKVFVLLSGFQDSENIYPVKMEIKTFKVKENPKLYVLVTSEHIKKEKFFIFPKEHKLNPNGPKNLSSVKVSKLLKNVNIKSESLIKYIPDGYLNPEKLEVKRKALETEKEYILQKQKNREIKIEQRQQRREERRALREQKGESLEAIKQPPETKPLSLAEKNLMALREKKAREKDKGIEK